MAKDDFHGFAYNYYTVKLNRDALFEGFSDLTYKMLTWPNLVTEVIDQEKLLGEVVNCFVDSMDLDEFLDSLYTPWYTRAWYWFTDLFRR